MSDADNKQRMMRTNETEEKDEEELAEKKKQTQN